MPSGAREGRAVHANPTCAAEVATSGRPFATILGVLDANMEALLAAAPGTGYFDEIDWRDGSLTVAGWMLIPETPIERVMVRVDGRLHEPADRVVREDVEKAFGWISHARESGFHFRVDCPAPRGRIDLLGASGDRVVSRMSTFFDCDPKAEGRIAPPELTQRSTGVSGRFLRLQGLRIFTDFHDQIRRFLDHPEDLDLLDWGCGSGRVTAHFIDILKARVFGADIDAEAIAWCRRHLPEGHFEPVASEPPLPYPDQSFDVATACSVFTHLSRRHQDRWLAELARIIRPGGLLLATTHGQFAYRKALYQAGGAWRLRRLGLFSKRKLTGILDGELDPAFDGIAPPGYYRNVYQSRQHTVENWTGAFECLDYIERGVDGFQDLVALRRRSGPA